MKKILFIFSILVFVGFHCIGQQIVMSSQYMINDFAINPAVAGTKAYSPLVIDVRRQWMGIREAPLAQHLSYHTSVGSGLGVGGYLFNDVAGPSRRTGLLGAISKQINTSTNTKLSMAIAGSLSQFIFDRDKMITEDPDDITVARYSTNQLVPDIAIGAKWYGEKYHVGVSMYNLLQTRLDLFDVMTAVTSNLRRTVYVSGSYIIAPSRKSKLVFEPSTVLRFMFDAPFQFDVNLRAIYNKRVWGGISYRYKDAIAFMIGFSTSRFGVGYSYDLNTSRLNSYNSGSHEITLTFRGRNKHATGPPSGMFNSYECPTFN